MNQPLISVIVPCYRVEKYLSQCVNSILVQTYENLEIWLVNDGSPDRCGEICDEYSIKDSRIKVIHKENGGLSDARNVAINKSTGEWITFVDSDDFIAPDYIATLFRLAVENDCKCSVVQPVAFLDGEQPSPNYYNSYEVLSSTDAIAAMFYQTKLDTSAWNKLYHRSLFETGIRYPKGYLFEDNPTTYRLFALCDKIAVSQKQLYYYRLREGSIEGQDFTSNKLNQGLGIIRMMELYPEITNKVHKAFRCKQASLAFHFIMKMPSDYEKKDDLWKYVTDNRWMVIWNNDARMKTRIGCLLSYLGIPFVKKVFKIISKRS